MASITKVGLRPQIQADAVEASIEQAHAAALKAIPKPNLARNRFRPCGDCRGDGQIAGEATFYDDAIANSYTCPACGGHGGEYLPIHAPNFDIMRKLKGARADFLRNRYDDRKEYGWETHTIGERAAMRYGEIRARAVSPVHFGAAA